MALQANPEVLPAYTHMCICINYLFSLFFIHNQNPIKVLPQK